ncbi:MAG TPA: phosphatase domain-containing protein [Anaeromyxobacteraceae bacterium]|nr:phosphatase domain-containing protein [Anaeromyxobacteraceae bacterium]
MRPTFLLLTLTAFALPAAAEEPALLLPPTLGRTDAVWISGRVLKEAQGRHGPTAVRNVRTLTVGNLVGARVEVRFLGQTAAAVSGHDGEFEAVIAAAPGQPFPAGPQPAEVQVAGVTARTTVLVVPADAPFLVVSDFDDTVAVTHVESKRKLLATAFLEDGDTQPAVQGMARFYGCLAAAGRPGPVFVFVSGSPIQFAPRLLRFLEKNGFPPAALYLRNLGPSTLKGYKEPILRTLAARFPQPLVLVGDSGEKDPEIYAALSKDLPGRVRRIYIRRAGRSGPAGRFEGELLFRDPVDAQRDAIASGLAPPGCL